MSHFCVYVFHDENTDIESLLAPFNENLTIPHRVCSKPELLKRFKEDKYRNEDVKVTLKNALDWFGYYVKGKDIFSDYNDNAKWDWYEVGGRWGGTIKNDEMKVSAMVRGKKKIDTPYAFVTPEGKWVGRGDVHWFGLTTNDVDGKEWNKSFRKYLKTLGEGIVCTCVDCHI